MPTRMRGWRGGAVRLDPCARPAGAASCRARAARWLALTVPLALAALIAAPASTLAQTVEDTEVKRLERQMEIERAMIDAARRAKARRALETDETVTYEQILADPDNLDLNFRYAKAQVARGDFLGASATLERILMIDPALTKIRLFRALVLYHLDNLEDAEREFAAALAEELSPEERRETERYLRDIRHRRRRTRFASTTSMGWGFDTNRNAAPSSKERLFFDFPLPLTGTSRKRRDTHALVIQSLDVEHRLQEEMGHTLIGSFDYFLGEQTSADDLDLQSFAAEGGTVIETPLGAISSTGFANYLYLSRESFLRSQGVRLGAARALGERAALSTIGSWAHEDYMPITENTAADQRDGNRVTVDVLGTYLLTPTIQLAAGFGYENKGVEKPTEFNAYEGFSVTGSHTWLLGRGQFLLSSLTFGVDLYDEPDVAVSARIRRDKDVRARIAYGAPVALLIGDWLPDPFLENLTAMFSVEQTRSLSNITNYTYSNTKLDMIFSKRIDF